MPVYRPTLTRFAGKLMVFMLLGLWTVIQAQDNPSLILEALEYEGLTKTDTAVINAYLTIDIGQPLTRAQLLEDQNRLRATDYFKNVHAVIKPGSAKGLAVVTIQVEERHRPYFQFRSGFNELDGWYIIPLSLRFDNFFGNGNRLGWELVLSDRLGGSRLEFVRPFLRGSEYDLHVQLFGYNRSFLHFVSSGDTLENERYEQEVRNQGALIEIRGNSGIPRFFTIGYSSQTVRVDSFLTNGPENAQQLPAPSYLELHSGKKIVRRFIITATMDTRNNRMYPSGGWWGGIFYNQSATDLGSFANFYTFTADLRRYQKMWKDVVIAGRVKWGRVSEVAPFYEKFYLGGPNSLRGYADRGLTPEGYAEQIVQGNLEIRFPLSRRLKNSGSFSGVLFYDTGHAWKADQAFQTADMASSVGYGIRFRVPVIGLIRLDVAYPVPDYDVHVHLSLGHTF